MNILHLKRHLLPFCSGTLLVLLCEKVNFFEASGRQPLSVDKQKQHREKCKKNTEINDGKEFEISA